VSDQPFLESVLTQGLKNRNTLMFEKIDSFLAMSSFISAEWFKIIRLKRVGSNFAGCPQIV